jgi:2-dehydropantoate 2-reductase
LKAHQAWEVAREMTPLLGPNTAVFTAQNGLPWWYFYGIEGQYANRRIESVDPGGRQWDAIGPERVIGCTVYPATEVIAPGIVKHIDGDKFGLGEPNLAKTERTEKLSHLFASAGLKAPILPEIRNDIWLKFWGNLCFNPISVLTRATLDILATDPGTRACGASTARRASARIAPRCCRIWNAVAHSSSMRCSPRCRSSDASSNSTHRTSTRCWR